MGSEGEHDHLSCVLQSVQLGLEECKVVSAHAVPCARFLWSL